TYGRESATEHIAHQSRRLGAEMVGRLVPGVSESRGRSWDMNMSIIESRGYDLAAGVQSIFVVCRRATSHLGDSFVFDRHGRRFGDRSRLYIEYSRVGDRADVQIEIHLVSPSLDPNRMMALD